jgi:cobalamin biosynthesis protein CobD/CbiB
MVYVPTDWTTAVVILGAAILDYLVGDPPQWLHPVQVMGWVIHHYCRLIWARNLGKSRGKNRRYCISYCADWQYHC